MLPVFCLGITNKCINSYQFVISLSCYYMFWQLCAVLRELVCTLELRTHLDFLLIKFCVVCGCVYYVAAWCVCVCVCLCCRVLGTIDRQIIHTTTYYTEFINKNSNWACNSEGIDELPVDGT
jgi:hypothetical protein